jgi:hypothetical protein
MEVTVNEHEQVIKIIDTSLNDNDNDNDNNKDNDNNNDNNNDTDNNNGKAFSILKNTFIDWLNKIIMNIYDFLTFVGEELYQLQDNQFKID